MPGVYPNSQFSPRDEYDTDVHATDERRSESADGPAVPTWVVLLAANWKILLAGMLIAVAVTAVPQVLTPRQYSAESLIAPTVSWTQVQFEPKIKTIDSTSGQQNPTGALTPERRQALVDLIRSNTIEQDVRRQLAGKLPDSDLQTGDIVAHISGGLKPRSEILGIQAVADSPEKATMLAGAWARAYVDHVNRVYTPPDADSSIIELRDQAQQQLQKAQDALTASLRESRLEALDREINDDEQTVRLLRTPYQSSTTASLPSTSGGQQQGPSPSTTSVDSSMMLNDYRLAERRTLDDIAQTLRRLDATRESVRALISQTTADSSAVASAAAVSLVKAQLVSISGGLPAQVQFQLPVSDNGASRADLEALVNSIDQARTDVAAEFERRRQAYETARDQQVSQLEDNLRTLRAQREQADAQRKQLTSQRDLASDTYTALARKAEETRVAQGTQGREVELASEASFASPVPRFSMNALAVAALVGLVVASVAVLVASFARPAESTKPSGESTPLVTKAPPGEERRRREATS